MLGFFLFLKSQKFRESFENKVLFCQPYLGTPVSSLSHAPLREYENAAETLFINILTCEMVAEIEHRAGHTPKLSRQSNTGETQFYRVIQKFLK